MNANPCGVCGSLDLREILYRKQVPVQQNLVVRNQRAAEALPRGTLRLMVCERCGFLFNQTFDPSGLNYSEEYDNTQDCSSHFSAHTDRLVHHLINDRGVRNRRIVEVGCGRGAFLRKLVEAPGSGNTGHGFDPCYVGPLVDLGGRLRFDRRNYDASCASVAADIVLCRHCIGYMTDPVAVLRAIRAALGASPHALVCFEVQCAEWMLDNDMLCDFAYEVCAYFALDALSTAYARAGLAVTHVEHFFGGQYLWVEGKLAKPQAARFQPAGQLVRKALAFGRRQAEVLRTWNDRIDALAADHRLAIWGAGTKGACFANLVDPHRERIDCVVDLNPNKQGHFIPGTGHPIVGHRALAERGVTHALLMNPNYREENRSLLRAAGIAVELIDVLDWKLRASA